MDYKKMLDNEMNVVSEDDETVKGRKLLFLSDYIFGFTTYDVRVSELLAEKMIEVIDCILNRKTFEYQEAESNYINFITMVNTRFLEDKLDWGTSIRGAFFNKYGENGDTVAEYKLTSDLYIPKSEVELFFKELIEWSKS